MIKNMTTIFDLLLKHPSGRILEAGIFAFILLLFFEQYTDYFKLARINKAVEIIQKTEDTQLKANISSQIQEELQEILNPKIYSPWYERIMGGMFPFFIVSILCWKSQRLWFFQLNLYGLVLGIMLSLLPKFLPSILHCFVVTASLFLLLAIVAIYGLINPSSTNPIWDNPEK